MDSISLKDFMLTISVVDIVAIIIFTVRLTSNYRKLVCDVQKKDMILSASKEALAEKVNNNHCDIRDNVRRIDVYLEKHNEDYIPVYWE